jgi:small subunit ribosomal protein S3
VKAWVFKGEVFAHDPMAHEKREIEVQGGQSRM